MAKNVKGKTNIEGTITKAKMRAASRRDSVIHSGKDGSSGAAEGMDGGAGSNTEGAKQDEELPHILEYRITECNPLLSAFDCLAPQLFTLACGIFLGIVLVSAAVAVA